MGNRRARKPFFTRKWVSDGVSGLFLCGKTETSSRKYFTPETSRPPAGRWAFLHRGGRPARSYRTGFLGFRRHGRGPGLSASRTVTPARGVPTARRSRLSDNFFLFPYENDLNTLQYGHFIDEEPGRMAHAVVPLRTHPDGIDFDLDITGFDRLVGRNFSAYELDLRCTVFGKRE